MYLSSNVCTLIPFVGAVDRLEEASDEPNSDRYDLEERAGKLSARAALCSRGDVVEEKL